MIVLVAGATGSTGRLLVDQLLSGGHHVRAVVRSAEGLPVGVRDHERLSVIEASILDLSDDEMARHVGGCDGVASCLGHNMSFKGIFGHPRRLVTDATRRLCAAIRSNRPSAPVRFVLMNTNANQNRDLDERLSFGDRTVLSMLGVTLPPHVDNVEAAEFLRTEIGSGDAAVEWVAVRPDSLIDETSVTAYETRPSPTRGIIFNSGRTSRINVAHFMATLLTDESAWSEWRGRMPVLNNVAAAGEPSP